MNEKILALLLAALLATPSLTQARDARSQATRLTWLAIIVLARTPRERVDLNRANAAEIASMLPDVDSRTADNIVAWRARNGRFDSYLDLLRVPGMDGATIARNRHRMVL